MSNMAGNPRGSWEPLRSIIIMIILLIIIALACPMIWAALVEMSDAV